MDKLTDPEYIEKIGEFCDIWLCDASTGGKVPRSIPYFKQGFQALIREGIFKDEAELRKACLKEKLIILPNFLFDFEK